MHAARRERGTDHVVLGAGSVAVASIADIMLNVVDLEPPQVKESD